MDYALRKLSADDGLDIYHMLQELPGEENGFINGCNGKTYEQYKEWLEKSVNTAEGIGLEDWMVPQTSYWLYVDGRPVGVGKLRHCLTDRLREEGGHAGYAIRPSCRSRGYGKLLLGLLVREAAELGIDRLLLTVQNHNRHSIQLALANAGVVEKINDIRHFIWIDCI